MRKLLFLLLFGIFSSVLCAQTFTIVDFPTVFDQDAYAARLSCLSAANVGLEVNNRFVKELNRLKFFGAIPFSSGVGFGMYETYGYASYREHRFAVGLAKRMTPRWALALQAIPKMTTFGNDYEPLFSMDLNATGFAKFGDHLYGDSEIHVPIRVSSNTRNDAPLQSFIKMSLSYIFSKQCQTSVQIKQQLPYKTEVALQLCYTPVQALTIFGNASSSSDCGFGLQYVFKQITYRFQTQYRPIIGYSTTIGVNYQMSNSSKTTSYAL